MKDALVSIIVPVYNVEDYVLKCLKSLSHQKYKNIEIIIVDDGSTDQSGKICDVFVKTDKRAKVFHKKNGGLSSARNFGLKKASGGVVAFVDSDDYVEPEFISSLYKIMETDDAEVSVCGYNHKFPKRKVLSGKDAAIRLLTRQENIDLIVWNKLYKKALFDGIEFPEGKKHEDVLTTYKLLAKANKVAYLDQALYYYVERQGSITKVEKTEERLLMREQAAEEAVNYFKNDDDLRQAAEISLLWAKYNFLNYAIRGGIDRRYERISLSWLRKNVAKYKANKFLMRKLRLYNFLSTNFCGVLYKLLKKVF